MQARGLGNQFLSHIRNVDARRHVVRCFEDESVIHVDTRIDPPLRDSEDVGDRADPEDLDTFRAIDRRRADPRQGERARRERRRVAVAERLRDHLPQATSPHVRATSSPVNAESCSRSINLLTGQTRGVHRNTDEQGVIDGQCSRRRCAIDRREGRDSRWFRVRQIEAEIASSPFEERGPSSSRAVLSEPGRNAIIRTAYELLGLLTFSRP